MVTLLCASAAGVVLSQSSLTAPLVSAFRRRRIDPPRRQGLADRLRPKLGEYGPQRAYARRERVTVALDNVVKLLGKSGGFFVREVKVHDPDMGSRVPVAKVGAWPPNVGSPVR